MPNSSQSPNRFAILHNQLSRNGLIIIPYEFVMASRIISSNPLQRCMQQQLQLQQQQQLQQQKHQHQLQQQ